MNSINEIYALMRAYIALRCLETKNLLGQELGRIKAEQEADYMEAINRIHEEGMII